MTFFLFGLLSKERYKTQDQLLDVARTVRRKALRSITSCRIGNMGSDKDGS
jgi:hypothetical protein